MYNPEHIFIWPSITTQGFRYPTNIFILRNISNPALMSQHINHSKSGCYEVNMLSEMFSDTDLDSVGLMKMISWYHISASHMRDQCWSNKILKWFFLYSDIVINVKQYFAASLHCQLYDMIKFSCFVCRRCRPSNLVTKCCCKKSSLRLWCNFCPGFCPRPSLITLHYPQTLLSFTRIRKLFSKDLFKTIELFAPNNNSVSL